MIMFGFDEKKTLVKNQHFNDTYYCEWLYFINIFPKLELDTANYLYIEVGLQLILRWS